MLRFAKWCLMMTEMLSDCLVKINLVYKISPDEVLSHIFTSHHLANLPQQLLIDHH